jgi:hypothetical protein
MHELIAGGVAWGLAVGFEAVVRRAGERRFIFVFSAAACRRVAASLPRDSLRVGAVLWRVLWRRPAAAIGDLRRQAFRHGGNGPRDAARRALVTAAQSLAPNEFAVDIPENGDWLCVHSLAATSRSDELEWPI